MSPPKIAGYEVREVLGEGGMGIVYKAWDPRLERFVALKVLSQDRAQPDDATERLERDARAAAQVEHPNVVAIYALHEHSGELCIEMEFVEGGTLRSRLDQRTIDPALAVAIARDVADALAAIHEKGIIHRDLKPGNVLLTKEDRVKVTDFGIARRRGEKAITETGKIMGTLQYMAPELLTGAAATPRSDVWSFGVLLHELLVGEHPFGGANAVPPPDPTRRLEASKAAGQGADHPLFVLRDECLRSDPMSRPASGAELRERIAALLESPESRRTSNPAAGNLPVPLTSFVGRAEELSDLSHRLESERLVTLLGPGGSGKTRLAIQGALASARRFESGAWFVDFSTLTQRDLILPTIANTIGVREAAPDELEQRVFDRLGDGRALLVLDNLEHVIVPAAQWIARALEQCHRLTVLATSRELTAIPGESVLAVGPMRLPEEAGLTAPELLLQYDALRLFAARAQAARSDFELTRGNASAAYDICRRLDGIPLALELAAARLRVLSLDQVRERLADRFKLLASGARTVSARQQTLQATLEWSHDLLSEDERILFRRLSAFEGGWTLEDAEAVAADDSLPRDLVLDVLGRLVEKSLVSLAAAGSAEGVREGRFRMLETVREFARSKLLGTTDEPAVRARHAEYFRAFASRANSGLTGEDQSAWLARCALEHDNLRVALGELSVRAPGNALAVAGALGRFWSTRGHLAEGIEWLRSLLTKAPPEPSVGRIEALLAAGQICRMRSEFDASHEFYEQARTLATTLDNPALLARSLNGLGSIRAIGSDFLGAVELYQEARGLHERLGDRRGISQALNNMGNMMLELGDLDRGARLYEESLTHTRTLGDDRQVAITLYNLGYLAISNAAFETATRYLDESLAVFEALGHQEGIAMCRMLSGRAATGSGDLDGADSHLADALELSIGLGSRLTTAHTRMAIADLAFARGDARAARSHLAEALRSFVDLRSMNDACDALARCVRVELQLRRPRTAARLQGAVEELRRTVGHPPTPVEARDQARSLALLANALPEADRSPLLREGGALDIDEALRLATAETGVDQ